MLTRAIGSMALLVLVGLLSIAEARSQGAIVNYMDSENGVYFYEPALNEEQRRTGQGAATLVGFRYYGRNEEREHVVVAVDQWGNVSWSATCESPCRTIKLSDGRRFSNRGNLLLSAVFEDAIGGRLENTHPTLLSVHIPRGSPVESSSIIAVDRTDYRAIRIFAEEGQEVRPIAAGLVVESGTFERYGNYVKIDHGADIQTIIGNLRDRPNLKGVVVSRSSRLGEIGSSRSSGEQFLIVEVRIAGVAVDPVLYVFADENAEGDYRFRHLFEAWRTKN